MSKLEAHQFSEQFFKERGELMSRLAKEKDALSLDAARLRIAYRQGFEHGMDDRYEVHDRIEIEAAYDLGWEAGRLIHNRAEFQKRVIEKLRQIHGVQT